MGHTYTMPYSGDIVMYMSWAHTGFELNLARCAAGIPAFKYLCSC